MRTTTFLKYSIASLVIGSIFLFQGASGATTRPEIHWTSWSPEVFAQAKRENKPIILDLEAVWCHWCHVMDAQTYSNPQIAALIQTHFIPVRVDQDSNPDLSNRYRDYGWPATIIFNPSGKEIVKESGYIATKDFLPILNKTVHSPNQPQFHDTAAVKYSANSVLKEELKDSLEKLLVSGYDSEHGGWGKEHRFLEWDTVEYCMFQGKAGHPPQLTNMVKQTLDAAQQIIDPVWGGMCQYSTSGDWAHPHYEKIMQVQTECLRIYALAYNLYQNPAYLHAAEQIDGFLNTFMLSPDGAYYTSMDADVIQGQDSHEYYKLNDAQRRQKGLPRIDKHIYPSENGRAIVALTTLYNVTGDGQCLKQALRATNWIVANRSIPGGGFSHAGQDEEQGGPFLDDSLSMGRAFLALYGATGDREWLAKAEQTASFIDANFKMLADSNTPGYASSSTATHSSLPPKPNVDQNVMLARFSNLLYWYDHEKKYEDIAKGAMRLLVTPEMTDDVGVYTGGILEANIELATAPVHTTVIGHKDDPKAKELMLAALAYPSNYKVTEWWDRRDGPLPNNDTEFPELDKAAAFACANQRCSLPAFEPADIARILEHLKP